MNTKEIKDKFEHDTGEKIKCPLCKHTEFIKLNGFILLSLGNGEPKTVHSLCCKKCRYVLPFFE